MISVFGDHNIAHFISHTYVIQTLKVLFRAGDMSVPKFSILQTAEFLKFEVLT